MCISLKQLFKSVLESSFAGKNICRELIFNEIEDLKNSTLSERRIQRRCFFVHLANFFRTAGLQNTCEQLFLVPSTPSTAQK